MERLGNLQHRREDRRLSERDVSESKSRSIAAGSATGFLDCARNDRERSRSKFCNLWRFTLGCLL